MEIHKKSIGVIIWSENHEKLAKWYEEILGFKVSIKQNLPDDTYVGFDMGKNYFSIGKHSEVKGKSKDSFRTMIGFNVDSVSEFYEELKGKDVSFIAKPFESPEGGYYAMTLKDPDGNIIQFFSNKP